MRETIARRLTLAAVAAVALAGITLAPAAAQGETPIVNTTFLANVFDPGGAGPRGSATTLRVRVESLTPQSEAARWTSILRLRGERMLENELAGRDLGYMQIGNRFPERLVAAFETNVDGERHLVLITQRVVGVREIWSSARSADYMYRMVELTLDASGHGDGAMYAAARFRVEKDGTLGTRNLGFLPWRVSNLRAVAS
jgi:hypothetical protein